MFQKLKKNFGIRLLLLKMLIFCFSSQVVKDLEGFKSHENLDFRVVVPLNITEEIMEAIKSEQRETKISRIDRTPRSVNGLYYSLADENLLLPIEKQGVCGSCYAFTTACAIETAIGIKNKATPIRLSKQQIVDCTRGGKYQNQGCKGGSVRSALLYAKDVGLELENNYPYKGKAAFFCRLKFGKTHQIYDYRSIAFGNIDRIMSIIKNVGPVITYISAKMLRYNFGTGFYDNDACKKQPIDHVVLLVGWGTDKETGIDYWIIRNTWGEEWGVKGYGRIRRGKNTCNIETLMYYPLVY